MSAGYGSYRFSGAGWLREIPAHWGVTNGRRIFSQRKDRAYLGDQELTVSQKHGVIPKAQFVKLEGRKVVEVIQDASILKHVERGDFVISMRSFQGGLEFSDHTGCVSSAYVALRPTAPICAKYYAYLFKSIDYIQALQSTSNLVRDGQALRFENFTLVPLPQLKVREQQQIAAYLDVHTSKIDALIEKQGRMIETLEERRQAVISHAVTKGLNPNARMVNSGVAWLGFMPEHWAAVPLGYLSRVETGNRDTKNAKSEGAFPFFVRSQTIERIDSYTHDTEAILTAGDGAGVGKVFHHYAGKFSAHQRVYIMSKFRGTVGKYLFYYFSSLFAKVALDGSAKSTVDSLRRPLITGFLVTRPPVQEQEEIIEYLDHETASIDALSTKAREMIDVLKERRQALISAAVTGKIDVRGLA